MEEHEEYEDDEDDEEYFRGQPLLDLFFSPTWEELENKMEKIERQKNRSTRTASQKKVKMVDSRDYAWWEKENKEEEEKKMLEVFLSGSEAKIDDFAKFHITPLEYHGRIRLDDKELYEKLQEDDSFHRVSVCYFDFLLTDGACKQFRLRMEYWAGDADSNSGMFGNVYNIDSKTLVTQMNGRLGDCETWVINKSPLPGYTPHDVETLPSNKDYNHFVMCGDGMEFYEDDGPSIEPSEYVEDARSDSVVQAHYLMMASTTASIHPELFLESQPKDLREKFALAKAEKALEGTGVPVDISRTVAACEYTRLPTPFKKKWR